jgi:predicted RNA-binding protein
MSPESAATILRSIERLDEKIDANGEILHETRSEVREVKVIANQALAEGKKTNGRVTRIEEREAEARGEAREHRRVEDASDRSGEKWRGIIPTVIASSVSGLVVALTLLVVTGQL